MYVKKNQISRNMKSINICTQQKAHQVYVWPGLLRVTEDQSLVANLNT